MFVITVCMAIIQITYIQAPQMKQVKNDSLVYSEGYIDQQNLLSDSSQMISSALQSLKPTVQDNRTVKIQKPHLSSFHMHMEQNNSELSLSKYLKNNSQIRKQHTAVKSLRKLDKDKSKFLNYDSKIQKVALNPNSKAEKINELVELIESQRAFQCEQRLKEFGVSLLQIAQDVINQKKSVQRQIENLIDLNKLMTSKLKEVQKFLEQIKNTKSSCSSCQRSYSFSKNKDSPINYLDNFEFAKTIISSMEELELKKIQQQQGVTVSEMPFVQLILCFKNKSQGTRAYLSQGLLDRVASGPTLKQWIRQIDNKLGQFPNVSDFEKQQTDQNVMIQFLSLLKARQQDLLKNIKSSKDPNRELTTQKYSSLQTFLQILQSESSLYSQQEVMAYFGDMNRQLNLIEKKSGLKIIQADAQQIKHSMKQIKEYIREIY